MIDPVTGKAIVDAYKAPVTEKIVGAALDGLKQLMAPISATLSGKARLITARYDRLSEEERQNVDATAVLAMKRVEGREIPRAADFDPKVIASTIDGAAVETNEDLRQLWANLLAQEFAIGGVHPAFPKILAELTHEEATVLSSISESSELLRILSSVERYFPKRKFPAGSDFLVRFETLSQSVLARNGLVRRDGNVTTLTPLGKAFVKAVSGEGPEAMGSIDQD